MTARFHAVVRAVPILTAAALVMAACGSGGPDRVSSASAAAPGTHAVAPAAAAPAAPVEPAVGPAAVAAPVATSAVAKPAAAKHAAPATAAKPTKVVAKPLAKAVAASEADKVAYERSNGATDVGVTKDSIQLGSVNMHGMALGNVLTAPQARGNMATAAAINDRGGVLGRRITIEDCDDGPGEVARAKACIKKLVGENHIFSLVTAIDWATASIHDDLRQFHLPYVGAWAYSQTEWQDPFMFPTHMSMLNEALAGAHWAANVIRPKTYGLICLTSPEMQLACGNVQRVLDATGAKMVKKADVAISETSMGPYVLAMRAANPEHIIHYVINPSTIAKFMVESAQQGYYPPKGISGNHMGSEIVGSLFGKWPAGRYWTNTTYRFWGSELMATMAKYAVANRGEVHHIVQAGYVAINIFAEAAKEVGPDLTRDRLMAVLGSDKTWKSDATLDQTWTWVKTERGAPGTGRPGLGQNREFIYKYDDPNTLSNPDGTPNGWKPDPDQFVIYTDH
jgi:ABC-type branched-subunit amino acid transport system substrate-binding protein